MAADKRKAAQAHNSALDTEVVVRQGRWCQIVLRRHGFAVVADLDRAWPWYSWVLVVAEFAVFSSLASRWTEKREGQ